MKAYGNELFTIFAQAFRGNDIVGKLQGKCLDTRRIANSTKVQTRHRGQPISSGLLICVFVQAFGDAFEFTQVAVHFLCNNVISHWLSEKNSKNFAIMKKYFVLSVFIMLIGAFTNVQGQNSATPDKGVLVHGNVRLCNYERGCLITDNDIKHWTQKLEISYDGSDKTYGIYINVRGDIINLGVKYKSSGIESYTYEGTDRVTGRKVVVVTKQKLSWYLNNNGVDSHTEVESPKGIIVTVPATYTVFSVVPIKNK